MIRGILCAALVCSGAPALAQSMTTAAEIRPILTATKPNWAAVRNYDGQDLLYFTNLLAWRCGLDRIRYAVNGGKLKVWQAEPCHEGTATPNAMTAEGQLPYVSLPPDSVREVSIEILYDDGGRDFAVFPRQAIQMN